jgi:hypothetical protein
MEAVRVTKDEQAVLDAMRANQGLKVAVMAMVAVARSGELATKSSAALENAARALPEPKTAPMISIEQMKEALRADDCLYDNNKIWEQLGAGKAPNVPDAVIQEAYEKGGRVILRCASISGKAEALRAAGRHVGFYGKANQSHYSESVEKPEWIVVPSHIDRETLGRPKREVVTSDKPAPTPEDWFSVIAYARLEGGRQPKGCENLYAFTAESGTVVGSRVDNIRIDRDTYFGHDGDAVGAARFGRPRS